MASLSTIDRISYRMLSFRKKQHPKISTNPKILKISNLKSPNRSVLNSIQRSTLGLDVVIANNRTLSDIFCVVFF